MWQGLPHVFLTAVWFGSGMRPNPHGKSHHFLGKCPGNSMTWTCPKSMSCSSMENKYSVDKWHGMVMEFGVDLDQTYSVDLWRCEVTRNFHENPYRIFYRVDIVLCRHLGRFKSSTFYMLYLLFWSLFHVLAGRKGERRKLYEREEYGIWWSMVKVWRRK